MVALCARRRSLVQQAADEDGAALAVTDWRAVVKHPRVNLAIVATAGKNPLSEKPVGANARDLEDGYRVQLFTDTAAKAAAVGHWVDVKWPRATQ